MIGNQMDTVIQIRQKLPFVHSPFLIWQPMIMGTSGREGVDIHCSKPVSFPIQLIANPSNIFAGYNISGE